MKRKRAIERVPQGRQGFTLIEMMAVIILGALLVSLFIPDFGVLSRIDLREQAKVLGATIELARQRAVITGQPHRLVLDLDAAAYHLEWEVRTAEDPFAEDLSIDDRRLLLVAPPRPERSFEPIPTQAGRFTILREPLYLEGVEMPEGWIDQGLVFILFDRDGTTDPSTIIMASDGENRRFLEVRALAESVRIRDES